MFHVPNLLISLILILGCTTGAPMHEPYPQEDAQELDATILKADIARFYREVEGQRMFHAQIAGHVQDQEYAEAAKENREPKIYILRIALLYADILAVLDQAAHELNHDHLTEAQRKYDVAGVAYDAYLALPDAFYANEVAAWVEYSLVPTEALLKKENIPLLKGLREI